MEKEEVRVGSEFKEEFDNIVSIVNACHDIYPDIVANERQIETKDTLYIYDEKIEAASSNNDAFDFNESGSSWFETIRDNSVQAVTNKWSGFMEEVARKFHESFYYYEFQQYDKTAIELTEERQLLRKTKLDRIMEKLFPDINSYKTIDKTGEYVDIFGAILKMEVGNGVGETQPMMCRIFFRNKNNKLEPIEKEEAEEINKSLSNNGDDKNPESMEKTPMFDENANKICEKLVEMTEDDKFNFGDYYVLHHGTSNNDKDIISKIKEGSSANVVDVTCKKVTILSIIHAKWKVDSKIIRYNGRPILGVEYSISDKVSLNCLLCNDNDFIVSADQLVCYEDGNQFNIPFFDESSSDVKVNEEINKYIKDNNERDHLRIMKCPLPYSNSCVEVVCKSNINPEINKCKYCYHPEVVYFTKDGRQLLVNEKVVFCSDNNDLMPESEKHQCKMCHRYISSEEDYCDLCTKVKNSKNMNVDTKRTSDETYKAYRNLIPFNKRIFKKDRHAFEDDECVLLYINSKVFMLDKIKCDKAIKYKKL